MKSIQVLILCRFYVTYSWCLLFSIFRWISSTTSFELLTNERNTCSFGQFYMKIQLYLMLLHLTYSIRIKTINFRIADNSYNLLTKLPKNIFYSYFTLWTNYMKMWENVCDLLQNCSITEISFPDIHLTIFTKCSYPNSGFHFWFLI